MTARATNSRQQFLNKPVFFKMEALLIFVTTLAVVSSMYIPNTTYVVPTELLEQIFGSTPQPPNQTKPTAVDTPAVAPNESAFIEKHTRPYKKKTSNVIYETETPKTLELNINIKVNDCDKTGGSIKTTGDGTKNVKQNPEKGDPEINSRFVEDLSSTEDRVALQGDNCPSGKVRIGNLCETPDDET